MIGWALRHVMIWIGVAAAIMVAIGYSGDRFGIGERKGTVSVAASAGRPAAKTEASRTMAIRAGEGGHFLVDAVVDGVQVRFLVDTGATRVVLTPEDAERMSLGLRDRDFSEKHRTAGGIVRTAPMTLREVRIGQLAVRDVAASVNERSIGVSLLGMSFLGRLDGYRVEGDRLILSW